MKAFYIIKSLGTFGITLYYLTLSYVRPAKLTTLKKQWALSVMNYLGYSVSAEGDYKIDGPKIYVGNHVSYLDILLLMATNPHIAFLAKKEIKSWPVLGVAATRVGTLYIDRESKHDRENLRKQIGDQLLKNKSQLVIFPSGTTTLKEEKLWKKGIFEIAQYYNIPVQLFKIDYDPYHESSYIGEDSLIGKMTTQFTIPNKKASVSWLDSIHVSHPENDAEILRQKVART
jgi:1-acyl-sn-glycerol-3-phosphate acyltransferase